MLGTTTEPGVNKTLIDQLWHATGCPLPAPEWGYAYWGSSHNCGVGDMLQYCLHSEEGKDNPWSNTCAPAGTKIHCTEQSVSPSACPQMVRTSPSCKNVQDGVNCGDGVDVLPDGKNPVVSSAAECCALCQQYNATCTAWTWNERSNQICYIKKTCVAVASQGVVSGGVPPLNLPLELNVTLGYTPGSVTSMQVGAVPYAMLAPGEVSVKLPTFGVADIIVFKRNASGEPAFRCQAGQCIPAAVRATGANANRN